jgi:hypothetical protein
MGGRADSSGLRAGILVGRARILLGRVRILVG